LFGQFQFLLNIEQNTQAVKRTVLDTSIYTLPSIAISDLLTFPNRWSSQWAKATIRITCGLIIIILRVIFLVVMKDHWT